MHVMNIMLHFKIQKSTSFLDNIGLQSIYFIYRFVKRENLHVYCISYNIIFTLIIPQDIPYRKLGFLYKVILLQSKTLNFNKMFLFTILHFLLILVMPWFFFKVGGGWLVTFFGPEERLASSPQQRLYPTHTGLYLLV